MHHISGLFEEVKKNETERKIKRKGHKICNTEYQFMAHI
jgi:hypothetical protein